MLALTRIEVFVVALPSEIVGLTKSTEARTVLEKNREIRTIIVTT